MAADRFVTWRDQRPTATQLLQTLEDYVAGVGLVEKADTYSEDMPWWIVSIPGSPSFPFRRSLGFDRPTLDTERWFEVCVHGSDHIDVMTRGADHLTGAIADGFADLACKAWGGVPGLP